MKTILEQVRQALIDSIDAKALASSNHFFKEGEAAKVHGVRMAEVNKIAKAGFLQVKEYPKQNIFELCEELWKSGK